MFKKIIGIFQEYEQLKRMIDAQKELKPKLFFYAESGAYFRFYQSLLDDLLKHTSEPIFYLTSQINDPVFDIQHPKLKIFHIKELLSTALKQIHCQFFIMTMPDLGIKQLPKGPHIQEHVYLFHAIVSTHQQYHAHAFDSFDTIFIVGPHHEQEIRARESIKHLRPKKLVRAGYPLLEDLARQWEIKNSNSINNHPSTIDLFSNYREVSFKKSLILIAPTWGESSLMAQGIESLLESLKDTNCHIIIRPHPEFIKRCPKRIKAIQQWLTIHAYQHVVFEQDLASSLSLLDADILITDRSGIAFEYALATERPVLFINTPLKINNHSHQELGLEPIENQLRNTLGISLDISDLKKANQAIQDLLKNKDLYKRQLIEERTRLIFNWNQSVNYMREYLLSK